MKDFLGNLLMAVLVIATLIGLNEIRHDNLNKKRCELSQYKTREYEIINNKLHCRSSDNSTQELKKSELDKINKMIMNEK